MCLFRGLLYWPLTYKLINFIFNVINFHSLKYQTLQKVDAYTYLLRKEKWYEKKFPFPIYLEIEKELLEVDKNKEKRDYEFDSSISATVRLNEIVYI